MFSKRLASSSYSTYNPGSALSHVHCSSRTYVLCTTATLRGLPSCHGSSSSPWSTSSNAAGLVGAELSSTGVCMCVSMYVCCLLLSARGEGAPGHPGSLTVVSGHSSAGGWLRNSRVTRRAGGCSPILVDLHLSNAGNPNGCSLSHTHRVLFLQSVFTERLTHPQSKEMKQNHQFQHCLLLIAQYSCPVRGT